MAMLTETAHIKLPMKKMPTAPNKIGFLPHMSLSLLHHEVDAACLSRKAEPIQVYPAVEWKYSAIVGRAVVTIVTSRAARKTEV